MTEAPLYLDEAATSRVRREVLEAAWPYLTTEFGNPSSSHAVGQSAAAALDAARRQVADFFDCRRSEVLFTSGGTEADNLAIKGIALGEPRGRHLVTTRIEHEAVLASADYLARFHGFEVSYAPVDSDGRLDQEGLRRVLREDTTVVSVAQANNEIGTVQPIAALAAAAHEAGARFHTDAVQGVASLAPPTGDVDAVSIAGHKLGTPRGIGALYLRGGVRLEPLLHGGGQEFGRRSGTENVAGAVALATALRLTADDRTEAIRAAQAADRDAFIDAVRVHAPGARLTGHAVHRLPRHASFVLPGTSGESVLLELERRGILCSSGSACAAGRDEPSHVLTAMGLSAEVAQTAVRFSWAADVSAGQLLTAAAALGDAVRQVGALRA